MIILKVSIHKDFLRVFPHGEFGPPFFLFVPYIVGIVCVPARELLDEKASSTFNHFTNKPNHLGGGGEYIIA